MEFDLLERLNALDAKLDTLISTTGKTPDGQKYITARDVGRLVGLNPRTILNRSNLDSGDALFVPSLRFGGKRKYFDRRVTERLFRVSS